MSSHKVEPLPKYLDAIKTFPTPRNSTDVRSWFGLVNQLSSYAQLRDMVEPFRQFLSPKVKFYWDEKLDQVFNESKDSIVNSIKNGVQIFEIDKPVCLRPDWSKKGIGYILVQKHCTCASEMPDCCDDGWKVVLTGSRFLSGTESRYAAVEGEALAIVYGLEQTRYFTQGCDNLLVVTDHKPLVKVFGDRTLDEITNTRLFRLKQRTLQWRFQIAYSPGKTNFAADATSRYPCLHSSVCHLTLGDLSERVVVAALSNETTKITSIPWDTLASETQRDEVLSELSRAVIEGFGSTYKNITQFMRYKDSLFVQNGVVMYQDRAVIPKSLRPVVLDSLHAAHQGVSAMHLQAQSIAFWPGMTNDITNKRNQCHHCNRNAPSQASTPSEPADPPSCPFEHIFADFFDFGGHHYLVAGDRLSGFTEVFHTPKGSSNAGARGLVKCLRKWFATFGVPRQLSSDGGPEFTAEMTSDFLKSWGVSHRISSAYHPQSNGRAEVAVKSVKRLMGENLGHLGDLNTDSFLKAMLQFRNTPDPDCGISPAQIVFGRPLRDNLLFTDYLARETYSKRWQDAWQAKEEALRARFIRTSEVLNRHARYLPPLRPGDKCFVQNQTGQHAKKWHHTGTVKEVLKHEKYVVRMDGSDRVTCRNRKFLRRYTPASLSIQDGIRTTASDRPISSEPHLTTDWTDFKTPNTNVTELEDATQPPHGEKDQNLQENVSKLDDLPAPADDYQGPTLTPVEEHPPRKKLPLALRRLQDFNAPGLRETGGE